MYINHTYLFYTILVYVYYYLHVHNSTLQNCKGYGATHNKVWKMDGSNSWELRIFLPVTSALNIPSLFPNEGDADSSLKTTDVSWYFFMYIYVYFPLDFRVHSLLYCTYAILYHLYTHINIHMPYSYVYVYICMYMFTYLYPRHIDVLLHRHFENKWLS
jgi:hypothetical protein